MLKQKLIMLFLVIGMVSTFCALIYIAFRDTAIASSNMMDVGSLNLKTADTSGVNSTITATSMSPGDVIGPASISIRNSGNIDGTSLNISFFPLEHDSGPSSDPNLQINKTANEFAAEMIITTLSYGGTRLLGRIDDFNSNGHIDIQDAANADLTGLAGISASDSEFFIIRMQLSKGSNDFRADGIDIIINFKLNQ